VIYAELCKMLKTLAATGVGVLVSSHDLRLMRWADKICFMKAGKVMREMSAQDGPGELTCVLRLSEAFNSDEACEFFESRGEGEWEMVGSPSEICRAVGAFPANAVIDLRINERGMEKLYYG
jgi:ABC-type multidrug transport system ATPase subunit